VVEVRSTFGDRTAADAVAAALVEERLVACAQVGGPVSSTYRWRGAVERAEEWVLSVRTHHDRLPAVVSRIRELHAYDVPEVVATPVVGGDPDYLSWVADESQG
jgi:periplasmic divalent cation tolerance protein